ncbi:hypothetical protein V8G54_009794 [Vigna mungo]|uniref:Uncharacterized protein n=1 Tax=Vigna mungo TaxID=3915 RepID=A0AAQ3NXE6_VIGMU
MRQPVSTSPARHPLQHHELLFSQFKSCSLLFQDIPHRVPFLQLNHNPPSSSVRELLSVAALFDSTQPSRRPCAAYSHHVILSSLFSFQGAAAVSGLPWIVVIECGSCLNLLWAVWQQCYKINFCATHPE